MKEPRASWICGNSSSINYFLTPFILSCAGKTSPVQAINILSRTSTLITQCAELTSIKPINQHRFWVSPKIPLTQIRMLTNTSLSRRRIRPKHQQLIRNQRAQDVGLHPVIDNVHLAVGLGVAWSVQVAGREVAVGVFEFRLEEVVEFGKDVGDEGGVGVEVCEGCVSWVEGEGEEGEDIPMNITRRLLSLIICRRVGHSLMASFFGGIYAYLSRPADFISPSYLAMLAPSGLVMRSVT